MVVEITLITLLHGKLLLYSDNTEKQTQTTNRKEKANRARP